MLVDDIIESLRNSPEDWDAGDMQENGTDISHRKYNIYLWLRREYSHVTVMSNIGSIEIGFWEKRKLIKAIACFLSKIPVKRKTSKLSSLDSLPIREFPL